MSRCKPLSLALGNLSRSAFREEGSEKGGVDATGEQNGEESVQPRATAEG